MDGVITKILGVTKPEELGGLDLYLEKSYDAIARSNPMAWNNAVGALVAARDARKLGITMGIIWVASVRAQFVEQDPVIGTIAAVEDIIGNGDPSSIIGHKSTMQRWGFLLHRYTQFALKFQIMRRGICFLRNAVRRFCPDDRHLTPAHGDLILLALKSYHLAAVKPQLYCTILEVDPKSTGVTASDYMLYFYYRGLAFVALKRWREAAASMEAVMIIPATAVSAIMVEAYKVFLLVGVIQDGTLRMLPQSASHALQRVTRTLCGEYMEFAAACEARDTLQLMRAMEDGRATFLEDKLMKLVEVALGSLTKHSIRALTKTYVTLSINQIAETVQTTQEEVVALLREMIAENSLIARISRSDGMVSFLDEAPVEIQQVEAQIDQVRTLTRKIQQLDEAVSLSLPYVTEKLRNMPNYHELLIEYEVKRKAARGTLGAVTDFLRGGSGA